MVLPIDPRIKFRHLQAFMEVARQKSVNRAAELLHISQPAVTKTIRELEDILAVALLERDGRGIRLTSHGEVFMRYAGATLTALRQAVDSVAKERNLIGAKSHEMLGKGSGKHKFFADLIVNLRRDGAGLEATADSLLDVQAQRMGIHCRSRQRTKGEDAGHIGEIPLVAKADIHINGCAP